MSIKLEASGKDAMDLVDRVCKGLEWLGSKQMYVWRTEYTLEKLVKARNELEDVMKMAVETMEDAQRNGWSPRGLATGWVREGLVFVARADEVVARYREEFVEPPSAAVVGVLHCPCEAASRRALNARAIMRLNNILEHKDAGSKYATGAFEDVACNRSGFADLEATRPSSLADRLHELTAPRSRSPLASPYPSETIPHRINRQKRNRRRRLRRKQSEFEDAALVDKEQLICSVMDEAYSGAVAVSVHSEDGILPSDSFPVTISQHDTWITVGEDSLNVVTGPFEDAESNRWVSPELQRILNDTWHRIANPLFSFSIFRMMPRPLDEYKRAEDFPVPDSQHKIVFFGSEAVSDSQDQFSFSVEKIQLSSFVKYRTFARSQSYESVPVIIRVNAPRYIHRSRAPIDLVMALDVSESMAVGGKLDLLKQGSKFVVHNLDANDRLSIVFFGEEAALVLLPLTSMSTEAKSTTNQLISSMEAAGDGKMERAMELAHEILGGRLDDDRVACIMLLTDGEKYDQSSVECLQYLEKYPTYTFGLGCDHDPRPLYSLATRGHGTYSFVTENLASIRDAIALCIGGLTSIVAQDVNISIHYAHRDVTISGIMCGGYHCSSVEETAAAGMMGSVTVTITDLCGSEEKNIVVYVNIPREESSGIFPLTRKTKLLNVTCSYLCPLAGNAVHSDAIEVTVERPGRVKSGQDRSISVEVASEVTRAKVFRGVDEIWGEASSNRTDCFSTSWPNNVAKEVLEEKLKSLRDAINGTEEANAARDRWEDLATDLDTMMVGLSMEPGTDVISRSLPYMLSWLSSHRWQRAAMPGCTSKSQWFSFRTVRMQNMIDSVESAPITYI